MEVRKEDMMQICQILVLQPSRRVLELQRLWRGKMASRGWRFRCRGGYGRGRRDGHKSIPFLNRRHETEVRCEQEKPESGGKCMSGYLPLRLVGSLMRLISKGLKNKNKHFSFQLTRSVGWDSDQCQSLGDFL
jgi:hypothetical protein